jgi:hypothetical protein
MPRYKIAVGIITGGSMVHQGLVASFMQIANECTEYEFTPLFVDGIYICRNRNNVGGLFMQETDCDFLLMLDADNGITPDGLRFFMEDFEDPEVNIVTGKYMFKNDDPLKSGMMVVGSCEAHCPPYYHASLHESAFSKDVINLTQELGRGVVGCGCLMVRRKVFEEAPWPWFKVDWHKNDAGRTHMVGEDLYFSYHVQDHGFDIHLDQRIKSPHYAGSKCYPPEWTQYDFYRKPMEGLSHVVIKPLDEQTTKED